ncbi:MAG: TIGR01244 family phosphatase [Alphaproteobacteria bacterium]|nr:TIGR01244 family phosphatase [Alphaproteobacteria bacterium]MBV9555075.1 TIGR01244 family phosphatase [Alphaproteobacteria bacterium]
MPSMPPLMDLAPGLTAAGALTADNLEALASAGVKTIVNNRPDNEDPGQLSADEARRLCAGYGIAYHHIPFVAATLTRDDIDTFERVLDGAPKPLVAHCRSGTRSTMIWALTRVRAGEDPARLVALGTRNGVDIAALPALAAKLL